MSGPGIAGEEQAQALAAARLYAIIDLAYVEETDAAAAAAAVLDGGVGVLQLRAKGVAPAGLVPLARRIGSMAADAGVPFLINDHPELAAAVPGAGVHMGQDDGPIARARGIVGPGRLIGRSTHGVAQAVEAAAEGADYIGFGPLFATPTKPGRPAIGLGDIAEVQRRVPIPVFCIGGINASTLPGVLAAGALRVVVVSALLLAGDRADCARALVRAIDDFGKAPGDIAVRPA
jgi:thiamine-phosphate pyrophosphorylase